MTGPTLQSIRKSFGLDLAELGLVFTLIALGFLASGPLASAASDRYGRLPFIIAGTTLMPVGFAVMSLAPIWTILLSGAFLAGLGMGLFEGPLTALIVDLAPGSTAKWLNLLHFFFGLGALTGPPLIAIAFTQDLSWRVMYGALSIVGLTSAIPFIFIKTRPNSRPITHQRISMARIGNANSMASKLLPTRTRLFSRTGRSLSIDSLDWNCRWTNYCWKPHPVDPPTSPADNFNVFGCPGRTHLITSKQLTSSNGRLRHHRLSRRERISHGNGCGRIN